MKKEYITTFNGKKIYIVDGKYVRLHNDIDFLDGGHHLVYSFIPDDEIWIDDQQSPEEAYYTTIHELAENKLMEDKGMDYEAAHNIASRIEHRARQNEEAEV